MQKKNLPLIIGVLIPVVMILFIAGSIYLPRAAMRPKYNFLYATNGYENAYVIKDGRLAEWQAPTSTQDAYYPPPKPLAVSQLYLYDVKKDKSLALSFEEAKNFHLDPNPISPDGYEVSRGQGGGGFFPFFYDGGDYSSWYLKGQNTWKKLAIRTNEPYYYDVRFLGWVE